MVYSTSIQELIWRPIIRDDQSNEWLNKMTDDEIEQYYKELDEIVKELPLEEQQVAYITNIIDHSIIYDIFMLDKNRQERIKKLESL